MIDPSSLCSIIEKLKIQKTQINNRFWSAEANQELTNKHNLCAEATLDYLNKITNLANQTSELVLAGDFDETNNEIITITTDTEKSLYKLWNSIHNYEISYKKNSIKPHKFNRIAVLLVGHYRSFNYTQPYIMQYFDHMAHYVDYFFVTWDETDHNRRSPESGITKFPIKKLSPTIDITPYFGDKLKGLQILSTDEYSEIETGNEGASYGLYRLLNLTKLGKIANDLKKNYEVTNNFVYDQVVETRPDIGFVIHNYIYPLDECKNRTVNIVGRKLDDEGDDVYFMHHWYFRSDSPTNDFMANRFDFFATKATRSDPCYSNFHRAMGEYIHTFRDDFKIGFKESFDQEAMQSRVIITPGDIKQLLA